VPDYTKILLYSISYSKLRHDYKLDIDLKKVHMQLIGIYTKNMGNDL